MYTSVIGQHYAQKQQRVDVIRTSRENSDHAAVLVDKQIISSGDKNWTDSE